MGFRRISINPLPTGSPQLSQSCPVSIGGHTVCFDAQTAMKNDAFDSSPALFKSIIAITFASSIWLAVIIDHQSSISLLNLLANRMP